MKKKKDNDKIKKSVQTSSACDAGRALNSSDIKHMLCMHGWEYWQAYTST